MENPLKYIGDTASSEKERQIDIFNMSNDLFTPLHGKSEHYNQVMAALEVYDPEYPPVLKMKKDSLEGWAKKYIGEDGSTREFDRQNDLHYGRLTVGLHSDGRVQVGNATATNSLEYRKLCWEEMKAKVKALADVIEAGQRKGPQEVARLVTEERVFA